MKDIELIAKNYVESLGEIVPGYKYGCKFSEKFTFKYYFDFVFLTLDGQVPKEPPVAGGACGFTIDKKSKEIETLSFGDLGLLSQSEEELNEVFDNLNQIKNNSGSLNWLKSKYNLKSSQLLAFKKLLLQTDLKKEVILQQIDKIKKQTS